MIACHVSHFSKIYLSRIKTRLFSSGIGAAIQRCVYKWWSLIFIASLTFWCGQPYYVLFSESLVQACFSSIPVTFCRPGNGRRQAVEWWPNNQKVVSSSPLVAGIFLFLSLKCKSVFIFLNRSFETLAPFFGTFLEILTFQIQIIWSGNAGRVIRTPLAPTATLKLMLSQVFS